MGQVMVGGRQSVAVKVLPSLTLAWRPGQVQGCAQWLSGGVTV
jgi:hypothetical protein